MIKLQELARYSPLMLQAYMEDLGNYICTQMKQHMVMLMTAPGNAPSESNSITDSLARNYNTATGCSPNFSYMRSPLFTQVNNLTRVYHDLSYYISYTPRELYSLCTTTSGEPILSQYNFTPYLPIPYIEPTLGIWKDTTKKFWVLPIPLVAPILGNLLRTNMTVKDLRLFAAYMVFDDNDGVMNTSRLRIFTPEQFKSIFNYASMQGTVKDVDDYNNKCLLRACGLKNTTCGNCYRDLYGSVPVELDKARVLGLDSVLSQPITSDLITQVDVNAVNSLPATKAVSYISNINKSWSKNRDTGVPECSSFERTDVFYPYGHKEEGLKYGKLFLNKERILDNLKKLYNEKKLTTGALIYGSLCFSNFAIVPRSYANSPYVSNYVGSWVDNRLVFHSGTAEKAKLAELIFTASTVTLNAKLRADGDLEHIIDIPIKDYILLLEYTRTLVMQDDPCIKSGGQPIIESLYTLVLFAIGNPLKMTFRYSGTPDQERYAYAPGKFILGNPTLKAIHNAIVQRSNNTAGSRQVFKSPWEDMPTFELAQLLDYKLKPDSPVAVEAAKRVLSLLSKNLDDFNNNMLHTGDFIGKAPLIARDYVGLKAPENERWRYSSRLLVAKVNIAELKTDNPLDHKYLSCLGVLGLADNPAKLTPYGETGIIYTQKLLYMASDSGSSYQSLFHRVPGALYRFDIELQITIPNILLPYGEVRVSDKVIPEGYLHLYSLDRYKSYLNTGKARLSRERAFLAVMGQYDTLVRSSALMIALESVNKAIFFKNGYTSALYSNPAIFTDRDYLPKLRS